jgi:hypothetical protein
MTGEPRVLLLHDMGGGEARLVTADIYGQNPNFESLGIPLFPIVKPFYPERRDVGVDLVAAGLANALPAEMTTVLMSEGAILDGRNLVERYAQAESNAREHHLGRYETDAERLVRLVLERDLPGVKAMIEKGVDVNAPSCAYPAPQLPLRAALDTKNMELVRLLVAHGASYLDGEGRAWPWETGLVSGKVVEYMLELKAPLPRGQAAALLVTNLARDNELQALGQLLDAGIAFNVRFGQGSTPLMIAARDGTLEGVKLLVNHGADVHAKDDFGKTAADWTKKKDIREYLMNISAGK